MVATQDNVSGRGLKQILVVEDSPQVGNALGKLLETQGYCARVCETAGEALKMANESVPDGAIVDIHLPDESGLVLSQQLRQRMGPRRPIIVMSGDSSMETIRALSEAGATLFISKPVNAGRLMEHLKERAE